jgi:hypothetical protein
MHILIRKFIKWAPDMSSGFMIYKPSFMKIGSAKQKPVGG